MIPNDPHNQLIDDILARLLSGTLSKSDARNELHALIHVAQHTGFDARGDEHQDQSWQGLGHTEMMTALEQGRPGRYEFHVIMGESYEVQEQRMHRAGVLALKYSGTFHMVPGTDTRPESFVVQI